jgi:hypothetical protein
MLAGSGTGDVDSVAVKVEVFPEIVVNSKLPRLVAYGLDATKPAVPDTGPIELWRS